MYPSASDLTTFTSHFCLYMFLRMLFGFKNDPPTFQWVMYIILATLRWQFFLVYLDDVIIFLNTAKDHFKHVSAVLRFLPQAVVSPQLYK